MTCGLVDRQVLQNSQYRNEFGFEDMICGKNVSKIACKCPIYCPDKATTCDVVPRPLEKRRGDPFRKGLGIPLEKRPGYDATCHAIDVQL